jgi:hypothetical protein
MSDEFTVRPFAADDRAELMRMYVAMFPDAEADANVTALVAKLGEDWAGVAGRTSRARHSRDRAHRLLPQGAVE